MTPPEPAKKTYPPDFVRLALASLKKTGRLLPPDPSGILHRLKVDPALLQRYRSGNFPLRSADESSS